MSEFEGKFRMVKKDNLDYVVGGAKVTDSVDPGCKEKERTNRCDCGKYEPKEESWMGLDICDNCIHSRAKSESATTVYCTQDLI